MTRPLPYRRGAQWITAAGLTGLVIAGCTQHLNLRKQPFTEGAVPPLMVRESVSVQAARVETAGRSYDVGWYDLDINYAEFTHAAVHDLVQEIQRQEIAVTPDGARRLELAVMYVDLVRKFGAFECIVDYRVRTGDDGVRGLQARASGPNPRSACSAAVPMIAAETLKDAAVVAYLTGTPGADRR
ncbi:hypothetical protein L6Q96_02180 [Candidatus Binatia bacterium]|nr:hypothetical protein [Candidatus Binatia bacterium]